MREVIRIDGQVQEDEKPVEITHWQESGGWKKITSLPKEIDRMVYLGNCVCDGDMFASYNLGYINIYKGHLNSGKY